MYSQNLSLKRLGDNEGLVADAFDEMHDHWDYLKLSKYRMGKLVLPPGAVKVMECASQNALTVTVTSCRDLSLRLDFAHPKKRVFKRVTDRRFRLCRDDMFRLLPGNRVRLNNCSKDCAVEMTFTIIRSSAPNEPLMRDNRELSRVVQDQQREIRALRSKVRRLEGLQTLTG